MPSTFSRYFATKFKYSVSLYRKTYGQGPILTAKGLDTIFRNVFIEKLTFLHYNKGKEMAPTLGMSGGTLLVRKIPAADPTKVYVGDVVVLKDPKSSDDYIVRRLAATEGYEMVSSDDKDEPFVLEKDECWVVCDNEELKPKEAYDSRTFGPVNITDIIGRAIYCLRSAVDHGPVYNSDFSAEEDASVLAMELDVDEMARTHRE
ncbi:uncharacterized protein LOC127259409 isoform X2 [Andrographis paniculata]|uniref:uncharacterized protein LOC127259409 isoform X2 n=1 Tax=Andrographis paniculata TaxID=175694 RepID=UPI0021E82BD6|nr:uncharacterized protein LOC127259409 isoform X2 [Andrographis paniculata]